MKDYTGETTTRFIFENIISRFGCLRSLTGDQGTHFLNKTTEFLLTTFMLQHNKSSHYHSQENGAVEAFNKILERGITKFLSANEDDWDEKIPVTLWAYRKIVKIIHKKTPFQLVYGREVVVPVEFILPSMFISEATGMSDRSALWNRLSQVMELDETWFLVEFHQSVEW